MTPTQQFIVALITVLVPVIIPIVIKSIFEIKAQKIANLKALSEQYKDTIAQLCLSAESLFKEGNGELKYEWVLSKVAPIVHLPEDQLKGLIELVLAQTKASLKEEWDKIGVTKPSVVPPSGTNPNP